MSKHIGNMNGATVVQSHRSYKLNIASNVNGIQPNKPVTITYKVKNDQDAILKDYAIQHEKIMHFILVRRDLENFQHIHPDFNKDTGEFTVKVTFATDGSYRIFPDFTPGMSADNPQLLPVTLFKDIHVGNMEKYTAQTVVSDENNLKQVGDYTIRYLLSPNATPQAQKDFIYGLSIQKDGKQVTDLEPYLGALGHSVILHEGNLNFIHTHALEGVGLMKNKVIVWHLKL